MRNILLKVTVSVNYLVTAPLDNGREITAVSRWRRPWFLKCLDTFPENLVFCLQIICYIHTAKVVINHLTSKNYCEYLCKGNNCL